VKLLQNERRDIVYDLYLRSPVIEIFNDPYFPGNEPKQVNALFEDFYLFLCPKTAQE
jgi:hypothetical protein